MKILFRLNPNKLSTIFLDRLERAQILKGNFTRLLISINLDTDIMQ